MKKIYLGTISMEKNRWEPGSTPTFVVSDFVEKAIDDGFTGIELWEYHYTKASEEEKARLAAFEIPYIFNSYVSFEERKDEEYKMIGDAVKALGAKTIKFNLGNSRGCIPNIAEQIENLKRFSEFIPNDVKMLSECHANTIMEIPKYAGEIFNCLDAKRFGAIIHLMSNNDFIDQCFDAYGERICHMHCAYTGNDPKRLEFRSMNDGTDNIKNKLDYYKNKGYNGSYTIEFVKFEDTAEKHYLHAVENLTYLRNLLENNF